MSSLRLARDVLQGIWTHPANKRRRCRQIARAISFQVGSRLFNRRVITPIGTKGGRLWVERNRRAATKVLYANPPDWPHMLVWEARLGTGDLFIDGGANVGSYSILASAAGAHVIAVEPSEDVIPFLEENIQLNNADVEIVQCALGDRSGVANFTVGRDAMNKLDPTGETSVRVLTLDSLIGDRYIAGMKLDLEGGELGALSGAANALNEKRIALIQLEWNTLSDMRPVEDLLKRHQYGLYEPTPEGTLKPALSTDRAGDLFAAPLG